MATSSNIRIRIRKKLLEGKTDEVATIIKSDPQSMYIIFEALEDPLVRIRQNAAETLGIIGNKSARESLFPVLNDPDPIVKWKAAQSLGLLGDERGIAYLGSILGTEFHNKAILSLSQVGVPAVKHLATLLDSSNEEVRVGIIQILGKIADSQTIELLLTALWEDSPRIYRAAINSLVEIGVPTVEPLVNVLDDIDPPVLRHVINILIQIGDVRAVKPLIQLLRKEKNLQQDILKGLASFDHNYVATSLINFLDCMDEKFCREIHIALWIMGEDAIEPLENALGTTTEKVQLEIIDVLGKIRGNKVKNVLFRALNDPNHKIRAKTAEVLGNMGDNEAVEPLISALKDSSEEVRIKSAVALMNIGDRRAIESLVALLRDPYRAVRRSAAQALLQMPKASVVSVLKEQKVKDEAFNENTIEALVEIGDREAVEFMISLSRKAALQSKIIAALLALDQIAVDPLIQSLEHNNPSIRRIAASLLGKIGNREAIEPLARLCEDKDPDIQKTATIALKELLDELGYSSVESFINETGT